MKFKSYQTKKIKSYLKNNTLILFANGTNQKAQNWINIEQGLQKLKIKYYKSYNKLTIKALNNSIYTNIQGLINGPFFFFIPLAKHTIFKKTILLNETWEPLTFKLLALILNTKVYSIPQTNKMNSLKYSDSIAIFYQFLLIHMKFPQVMTKNSKQCDLNT